MGLRYSVIVRESDDTTFDELDWSLNIAQTREEADELAAQIFAEDNPVEIAIAEYDNAEGCGHCGIGTVCIGHIVDTLPSLPGLTHDEACSHAAADQGLDPLMATLNVGDIPYRLETTGNYAMVVRVFPPQRRHLDITRAAHGWRVVSIDSWHEPGELLTENESLPEVLAIIRSQPGWHRHRSNSPDPDPISARTEENRFSPHDPTTTKPQPPESLPPGL